MAMSSAERQRKYREKRNADVERRQYYLQKSKDKYANDKAAGKRKTVKDMTEREKRHMRKLWRAEKGIKREKLKSMSIPEIPSLFPRVTPPNISRQKRQSQRSENKKRAKYYRDLKEKDILIRNLNQKLHMYKKRFQREKAKHIKIETPRTKTRNLLKNVSCRFTGKLLSKVRRKVFEDNVLIQQIRDKYAESRKSRKRTIASVVFGSIVNKYGLHRRMSKKCGINISLRKTQKTYVPIGLKRRVIAFYLRDNNSRILNGMKRTVTVKKQKKQKRLLLDTLKNLHAKFNSEEGNSRTVSYSVFCKLRPFWVVFPVQSDRQTCLCRTCDNMQLQLNAISSLSALPKNPVEAIKRTVCSIKSRDCMYGSCETCKNNDSVPGLKKEQNETIAWQQWVTKKETRNIKRGKTTEEKVVSITVKETITGTLGELMTVFKRHLSVYKQHVFKSNTQFRYFKMRQENLKTNECLINIDFSENYICKHSEEVQSMHFGASKKQITLHTGVFYIHGKICETFCSVSDSLEHGPSAIWCHLKNVLYEIRQNNPMIDTVEFFSDGPFAQYRQKGNFYLMTKIPQQYGFKNVRWTFFETGHGKGVPDGVGGSLKREADRKVRYGHTIDCAKTFVDKLKGGKTKLWIVTDQEIEKERKLLEVKSLNRIYGTIKLHQILVDTEHSSTVWYRDLSCLCPANCEHFITKCAKLTSCEPNDNEQNAYDKKISLKRKQMIIENDCVNKDGIPDFKTHLNSLKKCKNYSQLQKQCKRIAGKIEEITVEATKIHVLLPRLVIDEAAAEFMPDDLPNEDVLPCKVHDDGNCLPSTASVLAYGNPDHVHEMRVRIILDQVKNEKYYLNDHFLGKGNVEQGTRSLKKQYAQYSEIFIPGTRLSDDKIKSIYRQEVMSVVEDKTFMGIWQLHALSSVLKLPIYSAYPNLGNKQVRNDMNKLIKPVVELTETPMYILWNSNREDMTNEHWIPNHFVPLVNCDSSGEKNEQQEDEEDVLIYLNEVNNSNVIHSSDNSDIDRPFTTGSVDVDRRGSIAVDSSIEVESVCTNQDQEGFNEVPGRHQRKTAKVSGVYDEELSDAPGQLIGEEMTKINKLQDENKNYIPCNQQGEISNASVIHNEESTVASDQPNKEERIITHTPQENDICSYKERVDQNNTNSIKQSPGEVSVFLSNQTTVKIINEPYMGKNVIVDFNGKPYVGLVKEEDNSTVLVECMRRNGKANGNSFSWALKIKDLSIFQKSEVIAFVKCVHVDKNRYKLDDFSWEIYQSHF